MPGSTMRFSTSDCVKMPTGCSASSTTIIDPMWPAAITSTTLRIGVSGDTEMGAFLTMLASGEFIVCCSAARCANCTCNCWRDWLSRLAMYCVQKRLKTVLFCISLKKSSACNS